MPDHPRSDTRVIQRRIANRQPTVHNRMLLVIDRYIDPAFDCIQQHELEQNPEVSLMSPRIVHHMGQLMDNHEHNRVKVMKFVMPGRIFLFFAKTEDEGFLVLSV